MPVVEVPGLGDVDFPDGTPNDVMETSIKHALLKKQSEAGKSTIQELNTNPQAVMEREIVSPSPPLNDQAFTAERQRSAIDESQRGLAPLKRAVIPTAAAAASMIPGVGPLAGATIQAGGTAINQLLGQEPYSATEIAKSAAMPLAAQGVVSAVKGGVKAAGKFVNPGATRTAGVEAGMEGMGAVPNTVDRAYAPKASGAAFQGVRATAEEVPTNLINRAVTTALNELPRANAPKMAVRYLKELSNTLDAEGSLPYADIHKQINGMYRRAQDLLAKNETEAGHALLNARSRIVDELDKVSPALKEANALYRREQSTEQIAKVLSNPRPDVKLGELLLNDPLVKGSFSVDDAKFIEKIAKQLATMGTQASPYSGVGARFLNLMATPLASAMGSKTGMYLLRQTFKDGNITPQGLATVAQFMRAYQAQGGEGN